MFISLSVSLAGILDKSESPNEEIINTMTLNIFDKLKRASNGFITKVEFQKWCSSTLEELESPSFDNIFDTFCSGGPILEEEEPDDGIPKLISETETKSSSKKINKSPEKKQLFIPINNDDLNSNDHDHDQVPEILPISLDNNEE